MDYRVWCAMLEAYSKLTTKPKTIDKVKEAFQIIWVNLSQEPINKAVKDLPKKATEGLCWSLELVVDTSNIHIVNEILAFDH